MKVQTNTQEVDVSGIETSKKMEMANNPILWSFLTDQLYTQQNAWIREYAQNARDVDKKWELIYPSMMVPEVQFVDNGPGMSKEFMLNEFCQAGFSTKRTNNRQSGGFGIGRLSGPQGTIFVCRNEDMIRTYTLTKGKDSIPTVHLLSEEPRPDDVKIGTTVRVPIEPTQINAVKNDINKFLKFFDLPGLPKVEYILKRNRWAIMKPTSTGYNQVQEATQVEVGGYTFPVTWNDISTAASSAKVSYEDQQILQKVYTRTSHGCLVVHVPVGSVNVALNRESIKFDAHTVTALLEVARVVVAELAETVNADFKKITTRWEAYKKRAELKANGLHGMFDLISKKIVWKGEEIKNDYITIPASMRVTVESYRGRRTKQPNDGLPLNVRPPSLTENRISDVTIDPHEIGNNQGSYYGKTVICILDTDDAVSRRLRAEYTMAHRIVFLNPPPATIRQPWKDVKNPLTDFDLVENPDLKTEWWQPVLKLLDMPANSPVPVKRLSEITPLPKAERAPRDPNAPRASVARNKFFVCKAGSFLNFEGLPEIDLEDEEVKVWVPIHAGGFDPGEAKKDNEKEWDKQPWYELAASSLKTPPRFKKGEAPDPHTIKIAIPNTELIGVPRAFRRQVPEHWVHILDYLRGLLPPEKEWARWVAIGNDTWSLANPDQLNVMKLGPKFGDQTPFGKFYQKVKELNDIKVKGNAITKTLALFDVAVPTVGNTTPASLGLIDFKAEYKKLIDSSVPLSIILAHGESSFSKEQLDFLIGHA